jgi:glycosyltransferase involved in cell wall biosynthesis
VLFFDRIAAATDDIAGRFPERKTFTLRNVPILKTIDEAQPPQEEKNKPVIIYAGVLGRVRGLKEIIQAMNHVTTDAELWLLGPWENDNFRAECQELEGWKKVKYMGMKKPHEVYGYMKTADIGLSLLYPIKNYLTSLPVKSFEYLACSVPMIMSNFEYWQEVFDGCALFTDPESPATIGSCIQQLLENSDKREQLQKAGQKLVKENYSWEAEKERLTTAYHEMTGGNNPS